MTDTLMAVRAHRQELRKTFRSHEGFSMQEVSTFQEMFDEYDEDKSGDIGRRELGKLLEDVFPVEFFPGLNLKVLLYKIDADGDGTLDFHDFLRLIREANNIEDGKRWLKEKAAVAEAGF